MEFVAIDRGPGVSNLDQCLKDGFTTGSSPGEGLGAIRRLSDVSDFYSVPGKGAAVLARWCSHSRVERRRPFSRIGAVNVPKPGQEVCGDSWGVEQTEQASTLLVADGLGHGYEASPPRSRRCACFAQVRVLAPGALVELAHKALRSSRGAAVAVARIDREPG